jgi:hypothetical protein
MPESGIYRFWHERSPQGIAPILIVLISYTELDQKLCDQLIISSPPRNATGPQLRPGNLVTDKEWLNDNRMGRDRLSGR